MTNLTMHKPKFGPAPYSTGRTAVAPLPGIPGMRNWLLSQRAAVYNLLGVEPDACAATQFSMFYRLESLYRIEVLGQLTLFGIL